MFSIIFSILARSLSSRVLVFAIRIGIPKISEKVSQNPSAFFLEIVCVAALRNSPRSSEAPTSTYQSAMGGVR